MSIELAQKRRLWPIGTTERRVPEKIRIPKDVSGDARCSLHAWSHEIARILQDVFTGEGTVLGHLQVQKHIVLAIFRSFVGCLLPRCDVFVMLMLHGGGWECRCGRIDCFGLRSRQKVSQCRLLLVLHNAFFRVAPESYQREETLQVFTVPIVALEIAQVLVEISDLVG